MASINSYKRALTDLVDGQRRLTGELKKLKQIHEATEAELVSLRHTHGNLKLKFETFLQFITLTEPLQSVAKVAEFAGLLRGAIQEDGISPTLAPIVPDVTGAVVHSVKRLSVVSFTSASFVTSVAKTAAELSTFFASITSQPSVAEQLSSPLKSPPSQKTPKGNTINRISGAISPLQIGASVTTVALPSSMVSPTAVTMVTSRGCSPISFPLETVLSPLVSLNSDPELAVAAMSNESENKESRHKNLNSSVGEPERVVLQPSVQLVDEISRQIQSMRLESVSSGASSNAQSDRFQSEIIRLRALVHTMKSQLAAALSEAQVLRASLSAQSHLEDLGALGSIAVSDRAPPRLRINEQPPPLKLPHLPVRPPPQHLRRTTHSQQGLRGTTPRSGDKSVPPTSVGASFQNPTDVPLPMADLIITYFVEDLCEILNATRASMRDLDALLTNWRRFCLATEKGSGVTGAGCSAPAAVQFFSEMHDEVLIRAAELLLRPANSRVPPHAPRFLLWKHVTEHMQSIELLEGCWTTMTNFADSVLCHLRMNVGVAFPELRSVAGTRLIPPPP